MTTPQCPKCGEAKSVANWQGGLWGCTACNFYFYYSANKMFTVQGQSVQVNPFMPTAPAQVINESTAVNKVQFAKQMISELSESERQELYLWLHEQGCRVYK